MRPVVAASLVLALVLGAVVFAVPGAFESGPIPVIDVHTHLGPERLGRSLALLERHRIRRVVNLSGAVVGRGLEVQLAAAAAHPGRVKVFVNLPWRGFGHPGWTEAQIASLVRARELGAAGLKVSKALGLGVRDPEGRLVAVDDPRLDPVFDAAGRLGLPVAIHSGDPRAFFEPAGPQNERWDELQANPHWSFHGGDFPSWEDVFAAFVRRVERHPGTTFIGVHFGNAPEDPERVAALLARLPNLYVDTAARVGELGRDDVPGRRETLRRIFIEHRTRILFGTDTMAMGESLVFGAPGLEPHTRADAQDFFAAHWRFFETADGGFAHPTPIQGRWTISGLDLPREVLHDLYHRNAERLFGWEAP